MKVNVFVAVVKLSQTKPFFMPTRIPDGVREETPSVHSSQACQDNCSIQKD